MLLAVVLLVLGLGLAVPSGGLLLRGLAGLLPGRIPKVGLGAVTLGLCLPALAAAVVAAARDATPIAAGTAFGSWTYLLGLGVGGGLLTARRPVEAPSVATLVGPALPVAATALALYDSVLTRAEGVLLLLVFGGYLAALVAEGSAIRGRADRLAAERVGGSVRRAGVAAVSGLAGLAAGGWLLAEGGVRLAAHTDLAAGFVGAVVVGGAAALERTAAGAAGIRVGDPRATDWLFGAAAASSALIAGVAALVRPLVVDGSGNVAFLAGALLYALAAGWFLVRGAGGRVLGAVLIALTIAWVVYSTRL